MYLTPDSLFQPTRPSRVRRHNYKSLNRLRQYSQIRGPSELTDGFCYSPATKRPKRLTNQADSKTRTLRDFRPFWVRAAVLCSVVVVKQGYHHANNKYTNDHELHCHHWFGNSTMFSYRFWFQSTSAHSAPMTFSYRFWKSSASSTVSRKFCLW